MSDHAERQGFNKSIAAYAASRKRRLFYFRELILGS